MAAAATLMCSRGVAATSTEDVQVAANVSSSQIYHYFGDKRSLTRAVIEYQTDAILGSQEPLLARLDDLDALRAWAERHPSLFNGTAVTAVAARWAHWPANSPKRHRCARRPRSELPAVATRHPRRPPSHDGSRELRPAPTSTSSPLRFSPRLQGGLLLNKTLRDGEPLETALNTMIDHIESFTAAETRRS